MGLGYIERTATTPRNIGHEASIRVIITLASTILFARAGAAQTGIVALGDSNTAGFGVAQHAAFPAQLEGMLRAAGNDVRVFNAGVAGDTFGAMLARLDYYVPAGTQITILQGGYNDVQRGGDSGSIAGSIQAIVSPASGARGKGRAVRLLYPDWDALGPSSRGLTAPFCERRRVLRRRPSRPRWATHDGGRTSGGGRPSSP